ncbi:MAG TPA: alpha/beta hydrolase [Casimicrobiaceae bacterium]|nr:alpha/beta hydrolase [Casimicrobiaceae bacterium]
MRTTLSGREVYAYTGSRAFESGRATIAFVHGAAGDHGVWALQSRYFAHHGWNALAVDLPGHGRSAGEPLASVRRIADWLVSLLDALSIETAVLAGHSMGALAALDAAARHPGRVAKLALVGVAVPMPVSETLLAAAKRDDHAALEMINAWSFSPAHQLGGNRMPGVWMTGNGMRLMERCGSGVLHTDLLACHRYTDGLSAAANVRCPTLIVLGERDRMAPAKNAGALAAALADKRVIKVPDGGHSLMVEAPDAVLDGLREFAARSFS